MLNISIKKLPLLLLLFPSCSRDPEPQLPNPTSVEIQVQTGVDAPALPAVQQQSLPKLFVDEKIDCTSVIEAANYFIRRGESNAILEFNEILAMQRPECVFMVENRVAWMCRILFVSEEAPIRAPMLGWHAGFDYDESKKTETWPLYPVARSGDTFFVLADHYRIAGMPEAVSDYIIFCQNHGQFRKEQLLESPIKERIADAHRLGKSKRLADLVGSEEYSGLLMQAGVDIAE